MKIYQKTVNLAARLCLAKSGPYTQSPLEDSRLFGPCPWKILRHYLWTNGFLSNPAPGENILSGNLVMETKCTPWPHLKPTLLQSIYEMSSSCFFGPRPWHIEIRHRVKKTSTINLFGFETLKLKIRRLKLWKPTVRTKIVPTRLGTCICRYLLDLCVIACWSHPTCKHVIHRLSLASAL